MIIYQCQTCGLILSESAQTESMMSIYEYLLTKEDFVCPDHSGMTITVQDCRRTRENIPYIKAVREVLHRMNIRTIEIENNFDRTDFCGLSLYR